MNKIIKKILQIKNKNYKEKCQKQIPIKEIKKMKSSQIRKKQISIWPNLY